MRSAAGVLLMALALGPACSKPKAIEVVPRSADVSGIRPDGLQLSLLLDVHNPNSFAITARSVTGILELQDGPELGRGRAPAEFTIPAEATLTIPAQLALHWTNLGLFAPYALGGKPLPYRVRGGAHVRAGALEMDVPFSVTGQLSSDQLLRLGMRGGTPLHSSTPTN